MDWFRNAKIKTKLLVLFGMIISLVLVPVFFMITTTNNVISDFINLNEGSNKRLTYAYDAASELANIRRYTLSMGYATEDDKVVDMYYELYQVSGEIFINCLNNYRNSLEADSLLSYSSKEEHIAIVESIIEIFSTDYQQLVSGIYYASQENDRDTVDFLVMDAIPIGNAITDKLRLLREMVQVRILDVTESTQTYANGAITTILVFSVISIGLLLIVSVVMTNITKVPIEKMETAVKEIARGNLAYPIRSNYTDELGMLSNHIGDMVDTISAMNKTVKIVDAMDQVIFVTDLEFNILYANQYAANLYGFERDLSIGRKCYSMLYRGQKNVCADCPVSEMKSDGENLPFVEWENFDDILGIWMACRTSFIRWVDGSLAQVCTQKDNTLHKENEERQIQHQESLRKAAEEASQMKSSFLANMSHEIRTPMNGIIGFSELALDDEIPPKTRDYLNKIRTNSEWLLRIINDILDISKIEAGKVALEYIPFDLHELFKSCQSVIEPKFKEKGISFFCYAEPTVGKLLIGDPTKLRQVIVNLLSNAIKFTNHGMVKFLVSIISSTENTITIQFEVKDSGIGMTPEQLENIFIPFVQADVSTTRKYGGTGLGLSITKSMLELMGSTLRVESVEGIGSKFSFHITFETLCQSEEESDVKQDAEYIRTSKPRFNGEVLVCEDNPMNRMVIIDHLSRLGLNTVPAFNGKECLDIVSDRMAQNNGNFDLIFMDIHMPVMDGLEATKKLIAMGCKTPIVALTANVMDNAEEMYRANGLIDCLPKPFTTQKLWNCLLKYLKPIDGNNEYIYEQSDDEKLQQRLIINFIEDNQATDDKINEALQEGDIKLAHRLAHTLKGVSTLVGQSKLAEAAYAVEKSLTDKNTEFIKKQMDTLSFELEKSLELLSLSINISGSRKNESTTLNIQDISRLLEELRPLLESSKAESLDLIDRLILVPSSELLIKQIKEYDFELALETLDHIKNNLEG